MQVGMAHPTSLDPHLDLAFLWFWNRDLIDHQGLTQGPDYGFLHRFCHQGFSW